jgi:Flp pilus assembly protein TadD
MRRAVLAAGLIFSLTAASPPVQLAIDSAIAAGRLQQARTMIARASADELDSQARLRLLSDLALAERKDALALNGFQALLRADPAAQWAAAGAGTASLRLGRTQEAIDYLQQATSNGSGAWQSWNALGVAMDRLGRWAEAQQAYSRAMVSAPERAEPLNNMGYSLLLQGKHRNARAAFESALRLAPNNLHARANLEIAQAIAGDFPAEPRQNESPADFAARLNNAGYTAWLSGNPASAKALLSRALSVSSHWYVRAANNLQRVGGKP